MSKIMKKSFGLIFLTICLTIGVPAYAQKNYECTIGAVKYGNENMQLWTMAPQTTFVGVSDKELVSTIHGPDILKLSEILPEKDGKSGRRYINKKTGDKTLFMEDKRKAETLMRVENSERNMVGYWACKSQ